MGRRWLAMAYRVYLRTYIVCGVISVYAQQGNLMTAEGPMETEDAERQRRNVSAANRRTADVVQKEQCDPGVAEPPHDWMEEEVIMGFRVWQLMFLALGGIVTVVVLLCCFMKCRVPRTKQEIEADFKRKEVTRRFRFLLDKVQIEDTSLRAALEKVNQLYNNREKMKRRKKKKIEDEELGSVGSSDLFTDEKLTIIGRVKKILGILKDEDSEAEDHSKGKSDPELTLDEEIVAKHSDSDEDDEEDSQMAKSQRSNSGIDRQRSESRDSGLLDFPKHDDLHSRVSLLHDSPPPAGRMSAYRDSQSEGSSPPDDQFASESSRKLVDSKKSESLESKHKTDSTDSQQSHDSDLGRKGTDSVESQDSESKTLRKQKTDSLESQDSESKTLRKHKTDSLESQSSDSAKHREYLSTQKRSFTEGDSRQSSRNGSKSKTGKHNNNGTSKLRKSLSKESKFSRGSSKESSSLESKPRNSKGGSDKGNSCDTPPV